MDTLEWYDKYGKGILSTIDWDKEMLNAGLPENSIVRDEPWRLNKCFQEYSTIANKVVREKIKESGLQFLGIGCYKIALLDDKCKVVKFIRNKCEDKHSFCSLRSELKYLHNHLNVICFPRLYDFASDGSSYVCEYISSLTNDMDFNEIQKFINGEGEFPEFIDKKSMSARSLMELKDICKSENLVAEDLSLFNWGVADRNGEPTLVLYDIYLTERK